MIKFRTPYQPTPGRFLLSPESPALLVGSCFADNMAASMRDCLWDAANPGGTLYNPLSIANVLELTLDNTGNLSFIEDSIFCDSRGLWHSWLFDSSVSDTSRDNVVRKISVKVEELQHRIRHSSVIFVTFGTAWVYTTDSFHCRIVANCHKQPASSFSRRRLSAEEITTLWSDLLQRLHARYPQLKVVFTVSPVRHLKDGFTENSLSKATLLLAVNSLTEQFTDFTDYFPAYEILIDDLRDYRFYAADLTHPSAEAVEYIWECLRRTYLDAEGEHLLNEGERLVRALNHRPLIPSDPANRRHQEKTRIQCREFSALHPGMLNPLSI